MTATSLPDLILYGRPDCDLCDEVRVLIHQLLEQRAAANLPVPDLVERDITSDLAWERAFFASIPVVELGGHRLETVTSAAKLRRLLGEVLDGAAVPMP
jgi:hypothetical protein